MIFSELHSHHEIKLLFSIKKAQMILLLYNMTGEINNYIYVVCFIMLVIRFNILERNSYNH